MVSYPCFKEIHKLKIISLASGSKGNSYFVKSGNTRILVDCGLNYKQLKERLESINEVPESINYILISHEHSDHISGLDVFYKKHSPQIYTNYMSAEVIEKNKPLLASKIHTFNNEIIKLGDFEVFPIPVSHDSVSCTAFTLSDGKDKVAIVTDLGYIDSKILECISGSKVVYIESNHDEVMLKNCQYPYIIKQRIAGSHGHLSNSEAGNAIVKLYNAGTKFFVLSHISENSNTYEKAYITIANILAENGINPDNDLTIRFAHQHRVGNNFILGEDKNG